MKVTTARIIPRGQWTLGALTGVHANPDKGVRFHAQNLLELPGKTRQTPADLNDEYTITVTRPDGFACTDDEAKTVMVMCLRQGPRKRR